MKIDFEILWIDDNEMFIDSLRDPLKRWMEERGFSLEILQHKSEDGIFDTLAKHVVELIVVDYRLQKKMKGDELIRAIRDHQYVQDIIFYSQGGIPDEVAQGHLDGVFSVDRSDAKDRIRQLVDWRIQRSSDLATVRGWIVADSIELEHMLDEAISCFFTHHRSEFVERVLRHEGLFDFGKKYLVLMGLIKDRIEIAGSSDGNAGDHLRQCQEVLKAFPDEIIQVRNTFAHQLHETVEGGTIKLRVRTKKKGYVEFTPATCAEVRKCILKHRTNLLKLCALLRRGTGHEQASNDAGAIAIDVDDSRQRESND